MAKVIDGQGEYTVKATGEVVKYNYSFVAYDSLEDMLENIEGGEATVLKNAQRMLKVDANNTAREKAKVENGHSTRKALSEEDKAANKAERQANKAMLDKIKALSPEQREALGF